jgi:hypothetical protein
MGKTFACAGVKNKKARVTPAFKEKAMKKLFVFVLTAGFLLSLAGCGSAPASSGSQEVIGKGLSGVPSFVNDAYLNASEDVLIGVGTYKYGNDTSKISAAKTFAETRARADISRQLQTLVKNMVNDYTATSELDPSSAISFQEDITQTLSKSDLRGARTVNMASENGVWWVVMDYSKSNAVEEVNQAAAAAKLKVPQAAAFNAIDRMNAAFDKEAGGGPEPVGD